MWSAVLSAFARAVWPGAMVSCCGVCAAFSSVEMGFCVCGSGGGSSRARYYLQVRRAKRGSPRTYFIVLLIAVSGMATPENKVPQCAVIHKQESRRNVPKSVLLAILGTMQFTLSATRRTPHGASRVVQAMSA